MMLRPIFFRLLMGLLLWGSMAVAQAQVKTLSSDPAIFIGELHAQLTKAGLGDRAKSAAGELSALWSSGAATDEEKEAIVAHVNIMLSKNLRINWAILDYVVAFLALKNEAAFVKIPTSQFFEVAQQCILEIDENRLRRYFQHL